MTAEAPAKTTPYGTLSLVSRIRLKGGRTGGTGAFSSDGSKVLAPRLNGWARMWCTLSGDLIRSFEIPEKAISSSFSACGRYHSTALRHSVTLRAFGPRTKKFELRSDVLTGGAPRKLKHIWRAGLDQKGIFRDGPSARRPDSDWLSRHLQDGVLSLAEPANPDGRWSPGSRSALRAYVMPEERDAVRLTRPDLLVPLAGSRSVICRGDNLFCFDQVSGKTLWQVCLSTNAMLLLAGDQGLVCLLKDFSLVLIDPDSGLLQAVFAPEFGAHPLAAGISPDGGIAAWACADGKLRLCRGSRFEDEASLQIQIADADRLQFVGRQHVLLSNGRSVEVIDTASGGQAFFGEGEHLGSSVEGALFSVKPQDGCAVFVNAFSGEVTPTDITACVACLFSPDGRVAWFLSVEKRKLVLRRIITSTGLCESRARLAARVNETAVYELSYIQGAPWPAVSVRMHAYLPTAADQAFFPTGGRVIVLNTAAIDAPYALPDGTLAVLLDDKTIRIWDTGTGTERAVLRGHESGILGVLLLPDGRLASWSDDSTIRIWDIATGAERAVLRGHEEAVSGAVLLADGGLASWSTDETIRIWDVEAGTERAVLRGQKSEESGALPLPNGRLLAWSEGSSTIRCWSLATHATAPFNAETRWRWQGANSIVVSPCGNHAVSGDYSNGDWSYQLHDLAQGIRSGLPAETGFLQHGWSLNERDPFFIDAIGRIKTNRDGNAVLADETGLAPRHVCSVIDIHSKQGALIGADDHKLLVRYGGSITQLSGNCSEFSIDQGFSATGRYIWKLNAGGAIDLVEARTQQVATSLNAGEGFALSQLAFSQDDAFLAVLSPGGDILVFDLFDGSLTGRAYREGGSADAMFVSRDGAWVHLLQDDEVEAWHLGCANDDAATAGKSVLRQNGIPASDKADLRAIFGSDFDRALRDLEAGGAYRSFEIPKKSGGKRRIEAPRGPLHALQKELSVRLQSVHEPEPGSHGFVEGRSIVSNARCHIRRRWVLNVDLKDFFPSVTEARVRGLFRAPPFDLGHEAAATLARLCCRNGSLPQGAPTSPVLANFAARQLDLELQSIALKYNLAVTRYADDITLSSDAERFPSEIALRLGGGETEILTIAGPVLEDAITRSGFAINTAKTRLQYRSERQVVTGLVVNARLSPMRGHIKLVRALIHAWESQGLAAAAEDYFTRHPERLGRGRAAHKIEDFRSTVYGHMSFLHMVRGKTDRQVIAFCRRLSRIDVKNPPVFVREALQQEDGLAGITQ
jgi:RNA-directed DNA polymerase